MRIRPSVAPLALSFLAFACGDPDTQPDAKAAVRDPAQIFATQCALCHGPAGEGDTAMARGYPNANLADGEFAHGGTHEEIVHTITNGIPRSPMLPLKSRLTPEEIDGLARHVRALVRR